MDKDKALKLALELLAVGTFYSPELQAKRTEVIEQCLDALAQPEQETQAYREAAQLANWLFKKHYAQEEYYASGRVVWGYVTQPSA